MSEGNWRLAAFAGLAALFCAAGFGGYWGSLYSPDNKHYDAVGGGKGRSSSYQGVTHSLPDAAGVPEPIERAIANPPPNSGQDHEKRDLAAQEAMAVWAFWMLVATLGTLLVAIAGTVLIWRQVSLTRKAVEDTGAATKAMVKANRIAKQALSAAQAASRADLRPYVHPTMAKIVDRFSDPLEVSIVFENSGRTPALRAEFYTYLSGEDAGSAEVYKVVARDQAEPVGPIPPEARRQRSMAPSKLGEAIKEVRRMREQNVPEPKLVLRGFVRYRDTFGQRYVTDFVYASDKLPAGGEAIKMKPIHLDAPTYQQVDEQDQPVKN